MKTILTSLVFALAAVAQPSAADVLAKYIQALGGKAALEKVTTRAIKGTVENPDDNTHDPFEIYAKAPDKYILITGAPESGQSFECVNGDSGWAKDPDTGMHKMAPQEFALAKMDHDFQRDLRLLDLYPKMSVAGTSKVADRPAMVIVAAPASGSSEKLYFDAETGLLLKREYERVTFDDGIVPFEIFYDEYQDFDGVKVAVNIRQTTPDSTVLYTIKEVKFNAPSDDALFNPR